MRGVLLDFLSTWVSGGSGRDWSGETSVGGHAGIECGVFVCDGFSLPCLGKLKEELTCSICLDICVRPCTTPCGTESCENAMLDVWLCGVECVVGRCCYMVLIILCCSPG